MSLRKLTATLCVPVATAIALATSAPARAFTISPGTDETRAIADQFQVYARTEREALKNPDAIALDPQRLRTIVNENVRVIFINEGAGYRNTLQFEATAAGGKTTAGVVFPDISGTDTILPSKSAPLSIGDYVDLGTYAAPAQFDFSIVSNGANGGTSVLGVNPEENPDGLQHAIAYYQDDYIIIGFEDMVGGGDRDYNDVVFAVDFGRENAQAIAISAASAVPEPSSLFGVGIAAAVVLLARCKHLDSDKRTA